MTPEGGALTVLGIAGVFAILRHAARVNKEQAAADIAQHEGHVLRSRIKAEDVREAAKRRQHQITDAGTQIQLQRRGLLVPGLRSDDPAMARYTTEIAREPWR